MRRTRLRARSAKRRVENVERRVVLEQLVAERGPGCEARVEGVCTGQAQDGHEVLTRARGGSITDPANIKILCRRCHDWIGTHPEAAHERGLLKHSWDAA